VTVPTTPVAKAVSELLRIKRLPDEKRHPALVMYSGGLDSFAVLYALLTQTQVSVHAHHVELVNFEHRAAAENEAIARQRTYLETHCRPFTYTTSRYEFMADSSDGTDTQVTMFMAGRVYNLLEGRVWSLWTGHIQPPEWEIVEGSALLHSMFINRALRPVWMRPLRLLNKAQILASIPAETADLLWTCRTPVLKDGRFVPCGTCGACLVRPHGEAAAGGGQ